MLMQPTAAALCAVCIAAPLALPNGSALAGAPAHVLAASAAAVKLASLPSDPTLLEVLGLQIQTVNNIVEEGTTGAQALPTGFSLTSAEYVSVYEALNAYIKVASTVATQLVNGQFESIASSFQKNLAAANTALEGLPASIVASLQYNLDVIAAFVENLGVSTSDTSTATTSTEAVSTTSTATSSSLPSDPTLLEVLGLQIQTVNNIVEEGTTGAQALPTGFSLTSAQYVSIFEVLNAYIKVGSTVASQLVNGQFESIASSFQTNLDAANTALSGLVPSVVASLQYDLGVIQNFVTSSSTTSDATTSDTATAVSAASSTTSTAATSTSTTSTATSTATSSSLPSDPTLLEVLGLQIQTLNNIIEEGTTGAQSLPSGFSLTSAQYASVFEVLNAYIKVGSTVASQLVNGQFESIASSFQTNLDAANTALSKFVPSVVASLQYDATVTTNFLTGGSTSSAKTSAAAATTTASDTTDSATTKAATTASATTKAATTDSATTDSTATDSATTDSTATDSATTDSATTDSTTTKKAASTGGFLKQLQSAVDNEVGGGKVKVASEKADSATDSDSSATKSDKQSDTKKDSGSAKSDAATSSAKDSGDK